MSRKCIHQVVILFKYVPGANILGHFKRLLRVYFSKNKNEKKKKGVCRSLLSKKKNEEKRKEKEKKKCRILICKLRVKGKLQRFRIFFFKFLTENIRMGGIKYLQNS